MNKCILTNSVQCVSIHGAVSDLLPVTSGVPQGCILGPLLFLIFVNNFPTNVTPSRVLLFADDVNIAFPISFLDNCNQLQGDITKLLEWSNLWELHFNEKKCRVTHFHFRKVYEYNYHLNNHVLTVDTTHKDLGIVFSANLMWGPHFNLILSRAYKVLGLLYTQGFFHHSMCSIQAHSLSHPC